MGEKGVGGWEVEGCEGEGWVDGRWTGVRERGGWEGGGGEGAHGTHVRRGGRAGLRRTKRRHEPWDGAERGESMQCREEQIL